MINKENRFDSYAYRVAYRELDQSVTALEEGQWITFVDGKAVIADGTKKSFICLSSSRAGRDQMGVPVKKVSYLLGSFELSVTNFDTAKTYGDLTELVVVAGGMLAPRTTEESNLVVAYSISAPIGGSLRICSAY